MALGSFRAIVYASCWCTLTVNVSEDLMLVPLPVQNLASLQWVGGNKRQPSYSTYSNCVYVLIRPLLQVPWEPCDEET